jgi:hypothetical protein
LPAGGDAYVLARVLHNWTDEHAGTILRRVGAAMSPGARLLVFETFLTQDAAGAMVDLLMLGLLEGRERTAEEYRELLAHNGFTVTDVRPGLVEARRRA